MVGRRGIEPLQPKAADLQSAELTTCSTYPRDQPTGSGGSTPFRLTFFSWSRRRDSNPEPAVYKTAALPIELRRRTQGHAHAKTPGLANDIGWLCPGQARRRRPDGRPATGYSPDVGSSSTGAGVGPPGSSSSSVARDASGFGTDGARRARVRLFAGSAVVGAASVSERGP